MAVRSGVRDRHAADVDDLDVGDGVAPHFEVIESMTIVVDELDGSGCINPFGAMQCRCGEARNRGLAP